MASRPLHGGSTHPTGQGQELVITIPHAIEGILKNPPDHWLSDARLAHYQSLLLNPLHIQYSLSSALNPATLLPDLDATVKHECSIVLQHVQNLPPSPDLISPGQMQIRYSSQVKAALSRTPPGMRGWQWELE